MSQADTERDVLIVGGGPAGLAAGQFCARYGLRVLILDRDQSMLRQCAYLDNYLGFPAGVDVECFLQLAQAHAREAGCELLTTRVVSLERAGAGFIARTRDGAALSGRLALAASGCEADYLRGLQAPELFRADGELAEAAIDPYGRTSIAGLYVAGALAGLDNQALISAGHGARVALGMIRDLRSREYPWAALARHLDWQVPQGRYASQRWAAHVHAYFGQSLEDSSADASQLHGLIERWIETKRAQQISRRELARRRRRGHALWCALRPEPVQVQAVRP